MMLVPDAVAAVLELFARGGGDEYLGEPVTQLQHGLQAAALAEAAGASETLVAAALVHDIGHLLNPETLALGEAYLDAGDDEHERLGWLWLKENFVPEVADCTRLHVPAKRYLCAVEPAYAAGLSPASVKSLQAQGGPMSPDEVARFEKEPFYESAVRVRRWDDRAKDPHATTPPIEHFVPPLEASCQ